MSEREEGNSPVALALRKAGYRRAHRWWVTQEQFELMEYIASQNTADVIRIKVMVKEEFPSGRGSRRHGFVEDW